MDKCPCYNCLCIPICRNKLYKQLFMDCRPVYTYTFNLSGNPVANILEEVSNILSTKRWNIKDGDITFYGDGI